MRKRTSISPRDLDRLKRSELQALCRKHNIKGLTRKNAELVADLRAAFLEKQKEEISDVELSDSDIPVDEAEDSVDQDRSDLLDELTFAPSTFTKKVLSNISYTKEVPSTRAKSDTQRLGKAKKVSEYTKRVESEEESEDDTSMGIGKTGITQDTDMNDSFVFTFDSSAAKKSSITSKLAVEQQTKKSSLTNDFTKSSKSSVKSGEASHSRAKEPIRVPSSNDIETKTRLSHEPAEQTLGADQGSAIPKHKPTRPKRLVRHTVASKPFEIKVPKANQDEKSQDSKSNSDSRVAPHYTNTSPIEKRDEPRVSPELQPVPTKKRQREPENSKEASIHIPEKSNDYVPQAAPKLSSGVTHKAEIQTITEPLIKPTSHKAKSQSVESTFHDAFAGESVSEWLERIDLPSAIRTFERENMMDWKLVQLLTFEYLGVMGFTVGDALKLLLALKNKYPSEELAQANPLSHSQISLIQQIVDEKIQAALDSFSQSSAKPKAASGPNVQPKPTGTLQQTLQTQLQANVQHQQQPQTRPKVSATIANALSSNVSAGLSSSSSPLGLSISVNSDDRRDSIPKGNTIQKRSLWEKSISQPKESALPNKSIKAILNKSTTARQPVAKRAVATRTIRANSTDLQTIESPAKKRKLDSKTSEVPTKATSVLTTWHDEAVIDPLASSEQPPNHQVGDNPFKTKFTIPRTPPKSTPGEEGGKEESQAPGTGGRKKWSDIPPLETNWQPKYVP